MQVDKKLSRLQKQILRYLLAAPQDRIWGVHWQPSKGQHNYWSRSDAARLSCSLARLEQRGLVVRRNAVSGDNVGVDLGPNGVLKKR
jgi:hypothetical protein